MVDLALIRNPPGTPYNKLLEVQLPSFLACFWFYEYPDGEGPPGEGVYPRIRVSRANRKADSWQDLKGVTTDGPNISIWPPVGDPAWLRPKGGWFDVALDWHAAAHPGLTMYVAADNWNNSLPPAVTYVGGGNIHVMALRFDSYSPGQYRWYTGISWISTDRGKTWKYEDTYYRYWETLADGNQPFLPYYSYWDQNTCIAPNWIAAFYGVNLDYQVNEYVHDGFDFRLTDLNVYEFGEGGFVDGPNNSVGYNVGRLTGVGILFPPVYLGRSGDEIISSTGERIKDRAYMVVGTPQPTKLLNGDSWDTTYMVWKSTDGGKTWVDKHNFANSIPYLNIPAYNGNIFASNFDHVYPILLEYLGDDTVITLLPVEDAGVYAPFNMRLRCYYSTNGGTHWTAGGHIPVPGGIPYWSKDISESFIYRYIPLPYAESITYLGLRGDNRTEKWVLATVEWSTCSESVGETSRHMIHSKGVVYHYLSKDGGDSWSQVESPDYKRRVQTTANYQDLSYYGETNHDADFPGWMIDIDQGMSINYVGDNGAIPGRYTDTEGLPG